MSRVIVTGGAGFIGSAAAQGPATGRGDAIALDIPEPRLDVDRLRTDIVERAAFHHVLDRNDAAWDGPRSPAS